MFLFVLVLFCLVVGVSETSSLVLCLFVCFFQRCFLGFSRVFLGF